jgi:SLOG-like protein
MINIFLSASVPLPDRNKLWMETADVIAIRDSIKAIIEVVLGEAELVFGGHPAITPLIALLLRTVPPEQRRRVILFQSKWFEAEFVKENSEFIDFQLIPAEQDLALSLKMMRQAMLSSRGFDAAFFVGGMEGIAAEYEQFKQMHPSALCYPIASTGAAALKLYQDTNMDRRELLHELTYPTLFRRLMAEIKDQRKQHLFTR